MWAIFGTVVWSQHPSNGRVGDEYRCGLRVFATKQEARAAKNEKIREQIAERMRAVTFHFVVRRVS